MKLVALRCPKCQEPLAARAGELLFICAKCPTAVEASDAGLAALPLSFESDGHPWWQLSGQARVQKFAATHSAETPFGAVAHDGQSLPVSFLVPADTRPVPEIYRAALDSAGRKTSNAGRMKVLSGGVLSRRAAEQVARQVFLTLVARAPGRVHHLEFSLELPDAAVVIRAS